MTYSNFLKVKAELITFHQPSQNVIKSALKTAVTEHSHCIMFFFFSMNVHWVEAQVSDPGRDDSSSGGESDLGVAQNSLEVWTFT